MGDFKTLLNVLIGSIPGLSTLQRLPIVGDLLNGIVGNIAAGLAGFFGAKPAAPDLPPGYSYSDYPTQSTHYVETLPAAGSRIMPVDPSPPPPEPDTSSSRSTRIPGFGSGISGASSTYSRARGTGATTADRGIPVIGNPIPFNPKPGYRVVNEVLRRGGVVIHNDTGIPVGLWNPDIGELVKIRGFTKEGIMCLLGEGDSSKMVGTWISRPATTNTRPPDVWKNIRNNWGDDILAEQQTRAAAVADKIYPPFPWLFAGSGAVVVAVILIVLIRKGKI